VAYVRFASGSQGTDGDDLDDSAAGERADVAQAGAVFVAPARGDGGNGDGAGDGQRERAAPGPPTPAELAATEPGNDKPPRAG
jgi:hypothetical protein